MKRFFSLVALFLLTLSVSFAAATGDRIHVTDLPREARHTLRLIDAGGPFPYQRDGVVFNNFEKHLPIKQRGYYHEYTVRTPGIKHRGPRRIVTGNAGERYYTPDHYNSFQRIIQ